MRVAVLISGQPRGFAKLAWGCFVEKVIQQSASCSFDVFLSIQDQESVQFDGKVVLRAVTAQVEQEYRAVYGSNLKASKVSSWNSSCTSRPSYVQAVLVSFDTLQPCGILTGTFSEQSIAQGSPDAIRALSVAQAVCVARVGMGDDEGIRESKSIYLRSGGETQARRRSERSNRHFQAGC